MVLKSNNAVLAFKVLVQYLEYFNFSFEDVVDWHMKHPYNKVMSWKSCVVIISQYTLFCMCLLLQATVG